MKNSFFPHWGPKLKTKTLFEDTDSNTFSLNLQKQQTNNNKTLFQLTILR